MLTNAAPSSLKSEPPTRDELLARAFIEAGYAAADRRNGDGMRSTSYWLSNNIGILRLRLGDSETSRASRAAQPMSRRRDEFNALMFLQFAPLIEVTRAMRNFTRRLDKLGYDPAFEEFMEFAVEPALATLPPEAELAMQRHLSEMAEASATMVEGTPPACEQSNRPDVPDPNTSGQAGSPRA